MRRMRSGEYLLGWDETTSDYPMVKVGVVAGVLIIGIVLAIMLLNTYCEPEHP